MLERLRKALRGPREEKSSSARVLLALATGSGPARRTDYAQLAGRDYASNPIAFRCVRMLSEAAASAPLEARRAGRKADPDDPVAQLLRRPNPEQTAAELFETFFGHLQVGGNAYLEANELDGAPRELYALRPDRVGVIPGPSGWPAGWRIGAGERARRIMRDPVSGRAAMLHLKIFNPACDHYGVSPLAAAGISLDIHAASGAWNKALLENAARPSGALVYRGVSGADRLSDEQFDRLKAELADAHQGPKGAGRPLLLEGGLDWKPFGLSPAEMDFVEAKHVAAREIALAFGVPPMLLGIPGDNTYANYREANLAFWRQTVLPLTRKTARALEGWLRPWFGEDLDVAVRDDDVPALAEERAALWRRLDDATFLSPREKRRLAGLPIDETEV